MSSSVQTVHEENKRPLVISGPSGSGKSTLLTRLFKQYPNTFGFSVSHTTRTPRSGEQDKISYNFVKEDEFLKLIEEKAFIEYAQFSGNRYGTTIKAVQNVTEQGKICVLDIDMQGVKSVKATDLNARFVFIKPPSLEILEDRLRKRNTETEDSLRKRLDAAKAEMEYAEQPGSHDYIIVNDDVEISYKNMVGWIKENYKVTEEAAPEPKDAAESRTTSSAGKEVGAPAATTSEAAKPASDASEAADKKNSSDSKGKEPAQPAGKSEKKKSRLCTIM